MAYENDVQTLADIAQAFRAALDQVTQGFITGTFSKFPKECGADACDLLQYYLLNVHYIKSDYRVGKVQMSAQTPEIAHCYLVVNGIILDITADQFHKEWFPKVIVCESSEYPLIPYFKYVRSKSGQTLLPLNDYLQSIYGQVIKILQAKV
ncbi:hypothetical protein GCM10025882_30040 [Acinetobacter gyllenbergii]|uniref:Uncharacterized protein n=1 Tax=Acinetobacter gyllenbergii CIP 110306 = MTCC 11365 TaxID=1217657 RepID=A0A829HL42_9GAMM|nr:hypothetical protein [Acinetobacter gyllenbergii]EPF87917.1 hypothetical protein F957_01204 [Acinetobacter gyllenbergii CIP 110306 = MTCC 11365]EPH36008.1 hypothetical protein L293_0602 [Acinetobacter gyllenbergii CIP 110306 = MTCC 11365]ESK54846.1 hypothetical protein F987_00692 [Acinetobacter gyllenbergii NIPH 230]GMA12579.1 hypothetical protein GCM10025882_30040 [Acinetobacter gyllenbergii]